MQGLKTQGHWIFCKKILQVVALFGYSILVEILCKLQFYLDFGDL
jgi:hypothetical protein